MIRVDAQPTPDGELRRQILSKCVDKSEREWWAARTIEKLEFELNAANQIIRQQQLLEEDNLRLTDKIHQLYEGSEEQKQRIKRLEETGDALKTAGYFGGWGDAVNKWVKVKEAKP